MPFGPGTHRAPPNFSTLARLKWSAPEAPPPKAIGDDAEHEQGRDQGKRQCRGHNGSPTHKGVSSPRGPQSRGAGGQSHADRTVGFGKTGCPSGIAIEHQHRQTSGAKPSKRPPKKAPKKRPPPGQGSSAAP